MIDAWQATVVAYIGDGEIVHAREECVGSDVWELAAQASEDQPNGLADWQEFDQSLTESGFSALIRFSIHELESENAYELEREAEAGYLDDPDIAGLIEARGKAGDIADLKLDDPDVGDALDDLSRAIDKALEDLIEVLAKVTCDHCGEVIE